MCRVGDALYGCDYVIGQIAESEVPGLGPPDRERVAFERERCCVANREPRVAHQEQQ